MANTGRLGELLPIEPQVSCFQGKNIIAVASKRNNRMIFHGMKQMLVMINLRMQRGQTASVM
jgi:hypothetical protein